MKTYYQVLDISPRATDQEVRRAYRDLALRWHPDRNPNNRAQAQQMFVLCHTAYTMLKTAPQRRAYNRHLLAQKKNARPRRNGIVVRSFKNIREIVWPFAANTNRQARHG